MLYSRKGIVAINEETGERKDFSSINAAARELSSTFRNIQVAAIYNGNVKGWKIYESAESIKQHIKDLEKQLEIVNNK